MGSLGGLLEEGKVSGLGFCLEGLCGWGGTRTGTGLDCTYTINDTKHQPAFTDCALSERVRSFHDAHHIALLAAVIISSVMRYGVMRCNAMRCDPMRHDATSQVLV